MQYAPKKLSVPAGWEQLLTDFSREVLKSQPAEIYAFASDYFKAKAESAVDVSDELEALEDDEELDLDDPALEDATVKIQSTYRGYRSRKQGAEQRQSDKFNEMYDPEDADLKESAAKIQAGYRGHQARKERKREEQSAVKIQAQVRGHQQRKKAKSAKVVADMDIDLEDPEVHAAASKIQAGVRGRQVRKEAAEQNAAATKIQAQFRGHQSRKGGGEGAEDGEADETEPVDDAAAYDIDLADPEVNESATKIQAQFRGHQVRKEAAEQNAAATKIQAQFRGHQARKGGDETADTTETGDSAEAVDIDLNDPEVQASATKIQASFRGHQARKEVAAMKAGEDGADADAEPSADADPLQARFDKIKAIKESHPGNLAMKHFDFDYYNSLSDEEKVGFLQCVNTGIENADSGMGCYAMQPADYDRFKPFFSKVLAEYHKVAEDAKHVTNWSLEGVEGLPEGGQLDLAALGLPELSMRVRVGRNLKDFPLPGAMNKDDRIAMEKKVVAAFEVLKANEKYGGGYNSLTEGHPDFITMDKYQELVDKHIMFKDMAADTYLASAGIASDWPFGRGCYVSGDEQFIIWVGEEDHLRIMCMKKGALLNEVFDRLKEALDVVNSIEGLEFATSDDYGKVTSCPTNLGTGMRASVHIPIPNLTSDGTDAKAKAICKPLGLSVRGTGGEHTPIGKDGTCDISPSARFCITEAEIITALYNGLKLLKEEEAKAGDGDATAAEAEAAEPAAEAKVDEPAAEPATETTDAPAAEAAAEPAADAPAE